ncbi:MAG: hypothetical protein ACRC2T_20835 [Thermoguttaceae bacterium]
MTNDKKISRRNLLVAGTAGIAATAIAGGGDIQAQTRGAARTRQAAARKAPTFKNEQFYDKDGKFNEEKAKDAVVELCMYHGYPIFPDFKEKLWVSDYGCGKFADLGLACYSFCNHVDGEYSYMLSDLILLPGQMLPEHWHVKPENTPNCAQKDEGWAIRWGRSYVVGEGEPNLPKEVVVPKCHADGTVTVEHCVVADPGTFVPLSKVGTRHWQFAGKEGVILTEVANAHDNASVRHTDQTCNDTFLKGL